MSEKYTATVGRRKTASARIRLIPAKTSSFTVNGKELQAYFKTPTQIELAKAPLTVAAGEKTFAISAIVNGGGHHAQAEAVSHGVARAITEIDADTRTSLKKAYLLKRDPRKKERKKFEILGC